MSKRNDKQDKESSDSIVIEISSSSSNSDLKPHIQSPSANTDPKTTPKQQDTDILGQPCGNTQISSICKTESSSDTINLGSSESDPLTSILTGDADNFLVFEPNNFQPTKIERTEDILKEFISQLAEIMQIIKKERKKPEQKIKELSQLSSKLDIQSQREKQGETLIQSIQHQMDEILMEKDIKTIYQSFKDINETATMCKNVIMPVDINMVNVLLKETKTDQEILKGKDVVLILGNTGVGKTTAIHFLAGEKIEYVDQTLKAKKEQQLDNQMKDQIANLDKGTTKFVKINHKNNDFYLLDTQGLNQSDTLENDIANKQSLINSIQYCKSVKPVVIISKNSVGDRFTHVYSLFTSLQSIFENFDKAIPSITYLFTQYSDNEQHQLLADFKNKLQNLNSQEKSNKSYQYFIKDIINKLAGVDKISFSSSDEDFSDKEQQNNESRLLLNPAYDNHLDILDYLLQKQIENPGQKFKNFVSNEAISKLETQFDLHEKCIIEGINKADYELVKYKLDQLCLLSHYLNIQKFTQIYQKCQTEIVNELKKIGEQYMCSIEKYIKNASESTQHEITATQLLQLEQLMQFHVFHDKQSKICANKLIQMQQDLFKQLQQEIESDQPRKIPILDIMKTTSQSASKLGSNKKVEHIYSEACNFVLKTFKHLEKQTATHFKEFTVNNSSQLIEKYGTNLNRMQIIQQSYKVHIQIDHKSYSSTLQLMYDYLNDQLKILSQKDIQKDITKLVEQFFKIQKIIKFITESKILQKYVNKSTIQRNYDDLQNKVVKFAENQKIAIDQQLQDIESGILEINRDSLKLVEMQITLLQKLVENKEFKTCIDLVVQQCCQMVQSYAKDIQSKIEKAFNNIDIKFEQEELFSFAFLLNQFDECFKNERWYESQSQKPIQQLTQMLQSVKTYSNLQKIQQFAILYPNEKKLHKQLDKTCLQFKNSDLDQINKINAELATNVFISNLKLITTQLSDLQNNGVVIDQVNTAKQTLINNLQHYLTQQQHQLFSLQQEYSRQCFEGRTDINQLVQGAVLILTSMNQIVADLGQEQIYQIMVDQIKNTITGWNVEENKIIENLQSRLSNIELANINIIQNLTRYLKPLDQFTICNLKYAQIELYCEQALNQQVNQTYQQLSLYFTNQQFDLAQKALNKLNKDKQQIQEATEYARQYLQQYFHNYCVTVQNITQMSLQNFQIQYFNQIIQQLQQMTQVTSIQSVEGNYILNWQQNQAQISQFIQQIKQIIQPELIMQRCIQIPEGDYLQKEQLIQIMQQIITTLKQITEKIIQNQFMEVLSQIQDIYHQFENQIQQSIFNQSKQINNCKLNVKNNYQICVQFFNSLKQAAQIQQQKYNNIYQNVIMDLQSELVKQFIVFENKDSEEITDIIQNIEQNLKYLPCQIVDSIQTNLQNLKNIQETKKQQAENIAYETAAKDLKELIVSYVNYGNQQQYDITKIYQKTIQTEIHAKLKQINNNLSINDQKQIFDILPSAWDDWILYLEELNKFKLNKICQNSKFSTYYTDQNINSQLDLVIKNVIEVHNKSSQIILNEIVNIDNLKQFEKFTKNIDNILCYITNLLNNSSLSQHLRAKQDQQQMYNIVNDLFSKLLKIFQDKSMIFQNREQYIENGKIDQLLKAIKFVEQTDNLYQSLLDFSKSEACQKFQQFRDFDKIISHKQMMHILLSQIETNENECMNAIFICQDTNTANQADRDSFYKQIYKYFKFIQVFRLSHQQIAGIEDLSKIETKIMNKFNQQVENIYLEIEKQIKQLPNERTIQKQFSNLCDNLRSIGENFEQQQVANTAKSKILSVNMLFEQKSCELQNNVDQIEKNEQKLLESICKLLIEQKKMSVDIPQFKKQIDSGINKCISHIQTKFNQQTILKIGNLLQTHTDANIANLLISEHEKFKQISRTIRNTLRFTINDILDQKQENMDLYGEKFAINKGLYVIQQENPGNLKIQQINCDKIKEYYQLMDEKYWGLVEKYFNQQIGLDIIKQNIQNLQNKRIEQYTLQVKIDIVSQVFAFWTLQNALKSDENTNLMDSKSEQLQPHAAQVVAIFSLLGIDQSNQLKNQLIQVLTGEGKSVILAVTAIVLAIMGFDVNCACYSEYLSQRDYESFTDLFNAFNVRDNIVYGTFNQMCERYINQNGEIRTLTENCILNQKTKSTKAKGNNRQQILMIDEVDVFFNESFYGSSYTPMARVQNTEIKALLDYVWQNRNEKNLMNKNSITKTQEYLNCEKSLKGWEDLLKEALNNMILDIQQFDQHEYAVQDGLIGYKDQDTISTRIFYGYKTLFAYYQEVENPKKKGENDVKVKQIALDERKCLYFSCGSFSYAEIPKNYKHIIGVTGTLDTVSKPEMKLLTDEYNIKKFSYLPSVYGTNQLKFAKDSSDFVKIVEQKEYFTTIVSEINKRRQNKIGIPVLVFFETSAKLDLFYKSREFKSIDNYQQVKLFTEKISPIEKEGVVRQAVTQNTVTLITREFGRGTDFICHDRTIDDNGGVHVIQTFFSDELSEEKQIKGRTARQGKRGSYSLVLVDIDLQKYGLRTKQIETMKDTSKLHSTIDPFRQKYFDKKYPERIRNKQQILESHNRTGTYVKALFDGDNEAVRKYLVNENRGYSVDQSKSKTLILLDATGSMGEVIEKTKNTIKTMFTNAHAVLRENNVAESFEVMIAAYRNYSDNGQLFQCSGWEKNPDNLRTFIDTIKAFGGSSWGEEAIEVGLQHSNAELANGLTQVILIGDMGPNTREQIQIGRGFNGPEYWSKTPFTQTYFEDELQQLKGKVKVHALYVEKEARESFEYIARYTAGECRELGINSDQGAENLTHLVTERIVENIGGEVLLKKYKDKFGYV
ncbi:Conserved_hypothetical protein [Hexamita inflata]|uniref:SecA family profile domain-containing protein n=1 Tax=Hexamita inflata TaxID=28002 RepID=A0AA86PWU2_9EUKA|nr:Conserved hypothetical protein [Hexamita inflata]